MNDWDTSFTTHQKNCSYPRYYASSNSSGGERIQRPLLYPRFMQDVVYKTEIVDADLIGNWKEIDEHDPNGDSSGDQGYSDEHCLCTMSVRVVPEVVLSSTAMVHEIVNHQIDEPAATDTMTLLHGNIDLEGRSEENDDRVQGNCCFSTAAAFPESSDEEDSSDEELVSKPKSVRIVLLSGSQFGFNMPDYANCSEVVIKGGGGCSHQI